MTVVVDGERSSVEERIEAYREMIPWPGVLRERISLQLAVDAMALREEANALEAISKALAGD